MMKEKRLTPYKNDELNSPILKNPQLLRLKPGDLITLKEKFDKNQPRSGWLVLKVDFKSQKVQIERDSGRDLKSPEVKTISFELIDKIFADECKIQIVQENTNFQPIIADMTSFLLKVLNCAPAVISTPEERPQEYFDSKDVALDFSYQDLKTPDILQPDEDMKFFIQ